MDETRTLARFVAETPLEAIPSDVLEVVRLCILDDFASGFAGARHSWMDAVRSLHEGASGACSRFGQPELTSASAAALFNGVAVGGFETDHPYSPGGCHPGGAVFPAVLAAGEMGRIDGAAFLAATALGYEALCRVGVAATRAVEEERGFHGPGVNAAIGGALGAGRALGLDASTMTHAAGIAASHGGGLLEFNDEGSLTKRLHVGRGSQAGLESALLARAGFTGPSTALEGRHGFLNVYSPSPRPDLLLDELGERWLLTDVSFKAYPCHMSFQPVIAAIDRFRSDRAQGGQQLTPSAVEAVRIRSTHRMTSDRFSIARPTSLLGAQISLPWATALALSLDPASPASWSESSLGDPAVQALATRVEIVRETPSTAGVTAEVEVTVEGTRHVLEATDWKGAPSSPYSLDDLAEKLRRYAAGVVPAKQAEQLIEQVRDLEAVPDISRLTPLIRATAAGDA